MPSITLNRKEVAVLKSAVRRGESDPRFQEFLNTLDDLLNDETGHIHISDSTLNVIRRYVCVVNRPSWQGILFSIFGRTLRQAFGDSTLCTDLIAISGSKLVHHAGENNERNVLVV